MAAKFIQAFVALYGYTCCFVLFVTYQEQWYLIALKAIALRKQ